MTNGATTILASSLQVSGINNIEFTEEGEDPITASNVSYSNTTSGMTSGNVQNAIDELFQSVSGGAGGLRVIASGHNLPPISQDEPLSITLPSTPKMAFVGCKDGANILNTGIAVYPQTSSFEKARVLSPAYNNLDMADFRLSDTELIINYLDNDNNYYLVLG